MEQSQFNHIIYFHLQCFAYDNKAKRAKNLHLTNTTCNNEVLLAQKDEVIEAKYLKYNPPDEKRYNQAQQTTEKALSHYLQDSMYFLTKNENAKKELQDYLSVICPNTEASERKVIEEIFSEASSKANEFKPSEKDRDRLKIFEDAMCAGLNEKFGHNFTYKAPISNSFFMEIMSHPTTRLSAGIMLLAGLVSLSIGICLLAGVLPALAPSLAIGLTVAGAVATSVSSAVVITGFFGHRDPFDVDKDKNHIQYTNSPAAS